MSEDAKTFDPYLVDSNINSTIDIQKKTSNYVDVISEYDDEVVISNTKWYNECTPDPVTDDIDFYLQLNNKTFKVLENNRGGLKLEDITTEDKLDKKNIKDELTNVQRLVTDESGNPKKSGDNVSARIDVIVPNENGTSSTVETKEIQVPITPEYDKEVEVNLQSEVGYDDLEVEFVMYWLDKFRCAHRQVQADVRDSLSSEDVHYYMDFSESIGQLENVDFLGDGSTTIQPFDQDSILVPPPVVHNSVVDYILTDQTKELSTEFSKKTSSLFRRNMIKLQDDASTDEINTDSTKETVVSLSTAPHGINLIPDTQHKSRMNNVRSDIVSIIKEFLGEDGLDRVYRYMKNEGSDSNRQTVPKVQINMKIESSRVDVDLFKNKIQPLTTTSTNSACLV